MSKDFPLLNGADFDTLTPPEAELFARWIIRQFGEAESNLKGYQQDLGQTESDLKIEMARSRLHYGSISRADGKNYTEQQKEDQALVDNEILASECAKLQALVEISKGRINVLKAQSDLVRSVMVSVRTSMETERGPN